MSAEEFWNWFKENEENYFSFHQQNEVTKEILIEHFLDKLHAFCDGLYFKMGGFPGEKQQLIITAEGDIDYFEKVEELVSAAPKFKDWDIIPFKPALEGEFIVEYEGIELDSSELWFLPMQNHEDPKQFGLILGIPNFDPEERDRYLGAAYQLLDTLIGEKTTTEDIHFLDLDLLPENPEEDGYLNVSELKRYIDWHKDGIVPFNFSVN